MVNVKASTTRFGLSRFWLFKSSDFSYHSKVLSIYINEITKIFFTSSEFIKHGFAYDYSVVKASSNFIDLEIFVQDSAFEELRYIAKGFSNPLIYNLFFFRTKNKKINKTFSNFSVNFFLQKLKKRCFFSRKNKKKSQSKFYPQKIFKKRLFFKFSNFSSVNSITFKNYSFLSKRLFAHSFKAYSFDVASNWPRIDFFESFIGTSSNNFYFSKFKFFSKNSKRNIFLFKVFSHFFLIKRIFPISKFSRFFSSYYWRSGEAIQVFFSSSRKLTKKAYPSSLVVHQPKMSFTPFNENSQQSDDEIPVFYDRPDNEKSPFYYPFVNKNFINKIFYSTRFRIKSQFNSIKYLKRRTLVKEFFFKSSFAPNACITKFFSRFFSAFMFPSLPIRKFKITRLKYYSSNVSAYVFYCMVKLYYKYMLNDVIKPIIRGVSRYYKGFFVLCKGRFTRAQIASKKLFHRRFIYYNRMFWPLYYSYNSVALRYGASTVHIWIHH